MVSELTFSINEQVANIKPIIPMYIEEFSDYCLSLSENQRSWLEENNFYPDIGNWLLVPDEKGINSHVIYGMGCRKENSVSGKANNRYSFDPFLPGRLSRLLPNGNYEFTAELNNETSILAWILDAYQFTKYKASKTDKIAKIFVPEALNLDRLLSIARAVYIARDMINTPACDMGPGELAQIALDLSSAYGSKTNIITDKIDKEFPLVYAVGKASDREPCLIDFTWGSEKHPKITLVGKGVCFDTGGLHIKSGNYMDLMKKDMGGAAAVLGLAMLVMANNLPVRLRVIIPAVDNNISANAFRPGDIYKSRSGKTVEIGNTDAEGRLVLADALTLAAEDNPEILITMATLTGAARVALGPDIVPFYTTNSKFSEELIRQGKYQNDPLWLMPLWHDYDEWLNSKIADINNVSNNSFAGSIVAALFLSRFVSNLDNFIHFDIYGWTPMAKAGHPFGGEAQAIRAIFAFFENSFPK